MATAKIRWVKLKEYSLAWSAREAGFDLTMFDSYTPQAKSALKTAAVRMALDYLADEYEEKTGLSLKDLSWGVYVIRMTSGMSIRYEQGVSPVIYIGRGSVGGRVKSHFNDKLFPMMQSLSGANYDFWITEPKKGSRGRPSEKYHKQLEHNLLEKFEEKYGSLPLLNKNRGSDFGETLGENWDRPIRTRGQQPKWILEATKHFQVGK